MARPRGATLAQGYDSTGQSSQGAVGDCSPPDPPPRCRARPHRITETGAGRHTDVWLPTTAYHLAHALYAPAALPTPPGLRSSLAAIARSSPMIVELRWRFTPVPSKLVRVKCGRVHPTLRSHDTISMRYPPIHELRVSYWAHPRPWVSAF